MDRFRLGVVGHEARKFTLETEALARSAIERAIDRYGATEIVSGHSPVGGVDLWAEEIADERGIEPTIFAPDVHEWDPPGRYGFKARNVDIARHSDLVLVVVVRELPAGFRGRRFDSCYHCGDRNPPHVKSGACWTAWRCDRREWNIIGESNALRCP